MVPGVERILASFRTYETVASELLSDMQYVEKGNTRLFYNLDFSLVFGYIWGRSADAQPDFKPYGSVFEALTNIRRYDPGFEFVFTGPSFWELLDSIRHQIAELESYGAWDSSQRQKLLSSLKQRENFSDWKSVLIGRDRVVRQLEIIQESGFNSRITSPIERAMQLFGHDPVLRGLGDVLHGKVDIQQQYKEAYDRLFSEMLPERSRNKQEERQLDDRKFHFGIDTANIIASAAINGSIPNTKILFATQPALKKRYCPYDGRNPLVPYYWLSSLHLKEFGYHNSEMHFIGKMKDAAAEIKEELERIPLGKDASRLLKNEIVDFHSNYVVPLNESFRSVEARMSESREKYQQYEEILNDQEAFRRRFADAHDRLVDTGEKLAEINNHLLDDSLCELSDIKAHPVVDKIRRQFRLSS